MMLLGAIPATTRPKWPVSVPWSEGRAWDRQPALAINSS